MGYRPNHLDTVVAVKRTILVVCWLAINQAVGFSSALPWAQHDAYCLS